MKLWILLIPSTLSRFSDGVRWVRGYFLAASILEATTDGPVRLDDIEDHSLLVFTLLKNSSLRIL